MGPLNTFKSWFTSNHIKTSSVIALNEAARKGENKDFINELQSRIGKQKLEGSNKKLNNTEHVSYNDPRVKKSFFKKVYEFFTGKKETSSPLDEVLKKQQLQLNQAVKAGARDKLSPNTIALSTVYEGADFSSKVGDISQESSQQKTFSLFQTINHLFKSLVGSKEKKSISNSVESNNEKKTFTARLLDGCKTTKRVIQRSLTFFVETASELWTKISPSKRAQREDSRRSNELIGDSFDLEDKDPQAPMSLGDFINRQHNKADGEKGSFLEARGSSPNNHI